jgi:predicted nucleic acid-binding protein
MDAPARAIAAGRCTWWITRAMRTELAHVLTTRMTPREGRDPSSALQACRRWAHERQPPAGPPHRRLVCRDPDDQMFVDLAVATGARWLLTRDRALLALARHARPFGLEVVAPPRWSAPDP